MTMRRWDNLVSLLSIHAVVSQAHHYCYMLINGLQLKPEPTNSERPKNFCFIKTLHLSPIMLTAINGSY